MENMRSTPKSSILETSNKCAVILVFFIQVFRLFCVLLTFFFVFASLVIYEEELFAFDPPQPDENFTLATPETSKPMHETFHNTRDVIGVLLPVAEVSISLLIIYIVIGPLSPRITYGQWFNWLFKLRIFWMRVLWTSTAIAYAILMIKVREIKYKETFNPAYVDNDLVKVGLAFTTLEYVSLGVVQSVLKVIKVDTFEKRLQAYNSGIVGRWGKLCKLSYYLGMLAFALRNFSLMVYFAVLSTVDLTATNPDKYSIMLLPSEQDFVQQRILLSAMLVLQVYITVVRGKFYSFFLKIFLSNFLSEADDEKLQTDLQGKLMTDDEIYDTKRDLLEMDKLPQNVV